MIDPSLLREMFEYDAETGALTWKNRPTSHFRNGKQSAVQVAARWNSRMAGTPALSTIDSKGYLFGTINGRPYRQHRVIFALVHGRWPDGEVDHENGNRKANSASNLRDVSHRGNAVNMQQCSRNTSGRTGVRWRSDRGRWQAIIHSEGVTHHLGHFIQFEDAVSAREAAERVHGFHPNHGRKAA